MTVKEKIELVKVLGDGDTRLTDAVVSALLSQAKTVMLAKRYPFGEVDTELPAKYDTIQCQLAIRYYSRMGAEGEIAHTENGIARTYASVNDNDLLNMIVPVVGV